MLVILQKKKKKKEKLFDEIRTAVKNYGIFIHAFIINRVAT